MNNFPRWGTAFWALAALALAAHTKASAQTSNATSPDYSKEPYVIQSTSSKLAFQNDGKMTRDDTARVLIQSNAGVQAYGILHFPYASAMQTMEISYVRVRKADGSIVETPGGDVMEVTPDISREAPTYSDLKDKQVAVKGLQVGDTLEFESRSEITNPLIPGQFWYSYNFVRGAVALQEELQISVPRGRYVQVKNRDVQPTTTDRGDVRIYDWKTASLQPTPDDKDATPADPDEIPAVQLTTFHSWDEVGQWFKSLVEPQVAVTPVVRAKANALTSSAKSDSDRVHALYDFVSTKFRYVGISLGIGRYQPHAAADVLDNDFGDCKDKHTLFAALLAAVNLKAAPVLINSSGKIDPDVPSPGQFDHVITALPQNGAYLFLDTTPEVAPYGLLLGTLRDKQALLIPAQGPATLVRTPKDPPFPPFDHFSADATLDDAGTLVSTHQMTLRGDNEVVYRLILRQAGPAKWNDVMQSVSATLGFGGTVSDVSATSPEATDAPFQITYHYNRKEYSDWANRQITPPVPPFFLPDAPQDNKKAKPIKIGAAEETLYEAKFKLPSGSAPTLPAAVDLHESFADYHSSYSFADGTIHALRRLTTKVSEVPVAQIEAYRAFTKAISNDEDTYIPLRGGSGLSSTSSTAPGDSQGTPEARALLQQAQSAAQQGDRAAVLDATQRAVNADPQFSLGWYLLGTTQIVMSRYDEGVASLKKSIALNASDPSRYEPVVKQLVRLHREQAALDIWKAFEAASPADTSVPLRVAGILVGQKLYSDAAKELEPVAQRNPKDVAVLLMLGQAYLHSSDKEKGAALIVRAADMTQDAATLNDAASELAEANSHLDEALRYAQDAVQQAESASAKISLDSLTLADIRSIPTVAADWGTLGWVQYQLGHLDVAERYLNAVPEGTDKRLDTVQKGARFQDQVRPDPIALQDFRTTNIPWKVTASASAEFFLLFGPGAKVVDVKFVSGSGELHEATKAIVGTHFDVPLPDENPVHILRRGLMSCGPASSTTQCLFVLFPPASVDSVN